MHIVVEKKAERRKLGRNDAKRQNMIDKTSSKSTEKSPQRQVKIFVAVIIDFFFRIDCTYIISFDLKSMCLSVRLSVSSPSTFRTYRMLKPAPYLEQ